MKRRFFQVGSLLISNSYLGSFFYSKIYQGWFKGTCIPFMNCYGCPLAIASCPIGTLQHFVIIKAIPFLLIGLTLLVAFFVGEPWLCKLCPVGTLEAGIPIVLWNPGGDIFTQGGAVASRIGLLFDFKLLILFGFVAMAIFVHQPFCRFACPLGAIYSVFNKISFYRIKAYNEKCGFFHEYQETCPMEINAQQNPNDKDCIRCLECTKCKSLVFKPFWRR